jgi:hypothetical protein
MLTAIVRNIDTLSCHSHPYYQLSISFTFSTQLANFVTGDLFALNALVTVVAASMYGLGGTGLFEVTKTLAAGYALSLLLCCDKNGFSVDTIKNNVGQAVITVILLVLAFVE